MAAGDDELMRFVRDALARGAPRAAIERVLIEAGWPPAKVRPALAAFADVDFPIPVPRPRPQVSAREAFLYLVMFSALGLTAYHLGALLFGLIELNFPDPATQEWAAVAAAEEIRLSIATLVVSFPLCLLMARRIELEIKKRPEMRSSPIRRWLTYMTMFLAAIAVACDLVALVHGFLSGDLTINVTLKLLTVALIAGAILAHFLRAAAQDEAAA